MSAPAWMPLYVADYLADTGHLSTVEHGAYMLLIMHYWQNGGLPEDDRKLARICRLSAREWENIRETLADLFSDGWRHSRIDQELATSAKVSERRRAAGRIAGLASAKRRSTVQQSFNDESTIVQRNVDQTSTPSPSPTQEEEKKQTLSAGADRSLAKPQSEETPIAKPKPYPDEFEELWRDYCQITADAKAEPGSKKNAFEQWRRLSADEREACWIGVTEYALWRADQAGKSGVFVATPKHLERFIRGRCWETYRQEAA